MLINLLMKHPDYTQTKIAEELDWDVNTVKYYMNKPKKNFVIMRHGTSQSGYWEVLYKGLGDEIPCTRETRRVETMGASILEQVPFHTGF